MPNRRDFMLHSAVGAWLIAGAADAADKASSPAPKSLRVLILGGTGFIGPHFVQAALARGHRVAVFNRNQRDADLPPGVERLVGDRDGNLESIKGRDWDAVFDTAAYVPSWVRTLGEALNGRVRHYTFISTIMAYRFPGATDERSDLEVYTGSDDPYTVKTPGNYYGALKVLCEREGERQFPGKTLVLRPGHIVGPREAVGAFTYLVARMEQGGEVLAGGDPLTQVQLIDVRDLAEFAVRSAERGSTGAFTLVGPARPLGWAELLGAVRAAFSVPTELTWVPLPWLLEHRFKPFSSTIFWGSQMGIPGFTELNNDKARDHGLAFRPLNVTVADTLAWYRSLPAERQRMVLMPIDSSRALEDSMARERELLAEWRAQRKQ